MLRYQYHIVRIALLLLLFFSCRRPGRRMVRLVLLKPGIIIISRNPVTESCHFHK